MKDNFEKVLYMVNKTLPYEKVYERDIIEWLDDESNFNALNKYLEQNGIISYFDEIAYTYVYEYSEVNNG